MIGHPGAGKSFLCDQLSKKRGVPTYQLDDFFGGPKWIPRSSRDFLESVETLTKERSWIIDGNYPKAAEIRTERATVLVWLNVPFVPAFIRLVKRTFVRIWNKNKVCGDNKETDSNVFLSKDGIIYCLVINHSRNQLRFEHYWSRFSRGKTRTPFSRNNSTILWKKLSSFLN